MTVEDLVARYPLFSAAVADALLVLVIVFLVLWLVARSRGRRAARELAAATRDRLELQLTLSEQTGRLRIVGELNELAATSVSTLARNAEGVAITATGDAEAAARGAAALAENARAALADLRRSSSLAREGESDAAQLGPDPSLDTVDELFDGFRDLGLQVEVERTGERHELRRGAELALYRILQEALQNAWEHGGAGTTAKVAFRWTDDGLQLLVDDDGIRAAARREGRDPLRPSAEGAYTRDDDLAALTASPYGRGITEMRERTELFGGVFTVTTVAGVGFSVSAIFPALRYHNGVHGVKL